MNSRAVIFFVTAAVLLTGLFLLLRPLSEVTAPGARQPTKPAQATAPVLVELVVRGQTLVSGPDTIRLRQGDEITIRVTADVAEEFHLHGYDLKLDLEPGKPAEMNLVADRSGRFEYELEHSRLELGALEVLPH